MYARPYVPRSIRPRYRGDGGRRRHMRPVRGADLEVRFGKLSDELVPFLRGTVQ